MQGSSVCNNYGGKSNDSFLLSYGFVIENNSEDTCYIQIGYSDKDEAISNRKKQLLAKNNIPLGYYLRSDSMPENLFKALRICLATEEELYLSWNCDDKFANTAITLRNEKQVYKTLLHLLEKKLHGIAGGTEEDDEAKIASLKSKNATQSHMHSILIYRKGQKHILNNAIKALDSRWCLFTASNATVLNMYPEYASFAPLNMPTVANYVTALNPKLQVVADADFTQVALQTSSDIQV